MWGYAPEERWKVLTTRGFKKSLIMLIGNDRCSVRDIVSFLTLQPQVMGLLLRIANDVCEKNQISKPVTAGGIVNVFGLAGVTQQLDSIGDVDSDAESGIRNDATESYVLARVLAALAENRLGKVWAPEYFLIGLLHQTLAQDEALLNSCHEDLMSRFKGERSGPTLAGAHELIKSFRSYDGRKKDCLYQVWCNAVRHVRNALDKMEHLSEY